MYTFTNVTSRQLRHSVQVLDAALERHRDAENVTGRMIFTTNGVPRIFQFGSINLTK